MNTNFYFLILHLDSLWRGGRHELQMVYYQRKEGTSEGRIFQWACMRALPRKQKKRRGDPHPWVQRDISETIQRLYVKGKKSDVSQVFSTFADRIHIWRSICQPNFSGYCFSKLLPSSAAKQSTSFRVKMISLYKGFDRHKEHDI